MKTIPLVDLASQWDEIASEVMPSLSDSLRKGHYIGGEPVGRFESNFAAYVGRKHCVSCSNGTSAIHFALRALGVGVGDEVITQANTFIATAEAIALSGAKPVLVDIEESGVHAPDEAYLRAITPQTKAIIPVHLFGNPQDLSHIAKVCKGRGIFLLEDVAQAHGATVNDKMVGTFGDIGCFSFYPGKNLGAAGDGGAIVMDDDKIFNVVKMICNHGLSAPFNHEIIGSTERLDTIQAIILDAKLKRLDTWNEIRRLRAEQYLCGLNGVGDISFPVEKNNHKSCYHLFVMRTNCRDELFNFLKENGVGVGMHYPIPVHLTKAFSYLGIKKGVLPNAEKMAQMGLSLPMSPHLKESDCNYVIDLVRQFFTKNK